MNGVVTDPDRFDNDDLIEREASMGRSNFMLQFQLDTSLSDAEKFPLKMADLVITSVNPTEAPDNVIWCSDPSKRHQRTPNSWTPRGLLLLSNAVGKENGHLTQKQFVALTHRDEEQMKRQLLIYPRKTGSYICMKCELTEMGTQTHLAQHSTRM